MIRNAGLILFLILIGVPLQAERYAVLAGISSYQNGIHPLEGPVEDVRALRETLIKQGYEASHITVLLNGEAKRGNILRALDEAVTQLRAGDHLFFYFSGHGTSAFDKNSQEIRPAIGPDSGGLIPVDLAVDSIESVAASLLIGRRDLRPILARVPRQAQAFIVLDACYSENSAKTVGLWNKATPRSIRPMDLVKREASIPIGDVAQQTVANMVGEQRVEEPYPYSNVISLAAAAKSQTALDIGSGLIQQGAQTVDHKPHGALTNSLLLGLTGRGDTNGNGVISYDELFRFVRHDMERYPHQPQLLAPSNFLLDEPALGSRQIISHIPLTPEISSNSSGKVRVKLEKPNQHIESKLQAVPGLQLTQEPYDLLIRSETDQWKLYDASSTLLKGTPLAEPDQLIEQIRAYARLTILRNWSNPNQQFNVKLDVKPDSASGYDALRTTFRINEKASFQILTEQAAYLLLLDINKDGKIAVLFPGWEERERKPQAPYQPVTFTVPVTAPAGSDELKLIGFPKLPSDWSEWACTSKTCPEFKADDPRLAKLLQILTSQPGTAEASLRVITQE